MVDSGDGFPNPTGFFSRFLFCKLLGATHRDIFEQEAWLFRVSPSTKFSRLSGADAKLLFLNGFGADGGTFSSSPFLFLSFLRFAQFPCHFFFYRFQSFFLKRKISAPRTSIVSFGYPSPVPGPPPSRCSFFASPPFRRFHPTRAGPGCRRIHLLHVMALF